MTQILGISGKLQSGKSSTQNFIFGVVLSELNIIPWFRTDDNGELIVPTDETLVMYDIWAPHETNFEVWQTVKPYSFASKLKEFCVDVLGLEPKSVYGTDLDKNQPTHLLWENTPTFDQHERVGNMTGREVLEYFGTDICRKMYNNVWIDACIRQIRRDNPKLAIIADIRFPNEVDAVLDNGGKVIRLTRTIDDNPHISNVALDKDRYNWNRFSTIIDNHNMTKEEKEIEIFNKLNEWGLINAKYILQ